MNFHTASSIHEPQSLQEEYCEIDPYIAASATVHMQTYIHGLGQCVILMLVSGKVRTTIVLIATLLHF